MSAVIDIQNLKTYFHTDRGVVKAVDDISFQIKPGHTLGVVGESGSGKSVTSLTIMRLLAATAQVHDGTISFVGKDLINLPETEMRHIRGSEISMIFQEPMSSLNPVHKVGHQVMEAIMAHQEVDRAKAMQRTVELFEEVGIPDAEARIHYYPHQMSGGQKQRVMIAMALSCNPRLLIADEPTTALDVTIQKQILDLIRDLRDQRDMAVLFITHDLGVIAEIADDVVVMYRGKVVEQGDVLSVYRNPQHPYTKGLLSCRARLDTEFKRLPTVSDFMETEELDDGTVQIAPKEVTDQQMDFFKSYGRNRLLHPQSELEQLGYQDAAAAYGADASYVPLGTPPLLSVRDLEVHFPVKKGLLMRVVDHVKAVDGVSFDIYPGQTLGLVGESGCGKTTTGRALTRLVRPTAGTMIYHGEAIHSLRGEALQHFRSKVQIIFQDPYGSMNPRMTVQTALTEPMAIHGIGTSKRDRIDIAANLLEEVGMLPEHLSRYPHEFSGGQRQRICIARALSVEPEFIVCDESVSALDVSIQAQVLNLLNDLQERRNLTYIFISHDLSVVKFMSDMMAVMNHGKFVEFGPSESIYATPREEYTRRLIQATPRDDLENIERLVENRHATRQAKSP